MTDLDQKALVEAKSAAMQALGYRHGDTVVIGNISLNIGGAVQSAITAYLAALASSPAAVPSARPLREATPMSEDEEYAELLAALQASGTANAPRDGGGIHMSICDKAASAIKRLISERDEAREALRRIASRNFIYMTNSGSDNPDADAARALYREWKAIMEIARAARSPKPAKREGK